MHKEIKQLTQNSIDNFFLKCCKEGDLESLQGLSLVYSPKKQSPNKLFSYFLNITQNLRIGVNPHYKNDEGLKLASENNHIEVVKFLVKSKSFVKMINYNKNILNSFLKAIKAENIEVAKLIHSFILDKSMDNETYKSCIYKSFIDACYEGKLESVKYLLLDSSIPKHWMDHYPRTEPVIPAGFIAACEGGQPNVVKYLTNSFDFDNHYRCLSRHLNISNIEVMQHFIIDLELKREDNFIKNIYFKDPAALNNLFEKTALYDDLESSLNQNDNQAKKTTKKMKV